MFGREKKSKDEKGIKAIAWDFDGTIVDNHHIFMSAIRESFQAIVPLMSSEEEGGTLRDFYEALPPLLRGKVSLEAWGEIINQSCLEKLTYAHIRPGVLTLMEEARSRGIPQVCVSNSQKKSLVTRIEKLGLSHFFRDIIGVEDVEAPKPSPRPYALACQRLGLAPQSVVAIEDSPMGLKSAHSAGLKAVAYPKCPKESHRFQGAYMVLQDITKVTLLMEERKQRTELRLVRNQGR